MDQPDSTAAPNYPACPLSWARALRRNLRAPRGAERVQVERWLAHHGWRYVRGFGWTDPLDRDGWSLEWAIRLQALREAQLVLESKYELTGGCLFDDGHHWREAWEVRRVDRAGYCTVPAALQREGLQYPTPVARMKPRLVLIRGGRSAA